MELKEKVRKVKQRKVKDMMMAALRRPKCEKQFQHLRLQLIYESNDMPKHQERT